MARRAAGAPDPISNTPIKHNYPKQPSICLQSAAASTAASMATHTGRAGPTSGTYLIALISCRSLGLVGGARFLLIPRQEEDPSIAWWGSIADQPFQWHQRNHSSPLSLHYSALSQTSIPARARLRAHNSPKQRTWYRGRWHTAASLGQLPKPEVCNPRRARVQASSWRKPVKHLNLMSWNCSGLSSSMFQ